MTHEYQPTHLDLFSGIGGFAIAAGWAGFETIGFCEIDPYASAVLAKHWPDVPNYGDINHLIELAKNYAKPQGQIVRHSEIDVHTGKVNRSDSCDFWNNTASYVENPEAKRCVLQGQKEIWTRQPLLPWDKGGGLCAEQMGEVWSDKTRTMRTVQDCCGIQGRKDRDTSSPSRLHKTAGSAIPMSTLPPQMAHGTQCDWSITYDLITAGVPCQPASCAGKRRGQEDDRWLWPQTIEIIRIIKPTWCLLENVSGLVTLNGGVEFDNVLSDLEAIGYEVQPLVIPACAVDAKHRRDRVWIVAHARSPRRNAGSPERRGAISAWTHIDASGPGNNSSTVANCIGPRLEIGQEQPAWQKQPAAERGCLWPSEDEWFAQSGMGRMANGIPNRVDRLKGLGNAIVPQVAFQILKEIRKTLWE